MEPSICAIWIPIELLARTDRPPPVNVLRFLLRSFLFLLAVLRLTRFRWSFSPLERGPGGAHRLHQPCLLRILEPLILGGWNSTT